MGFADVIARLRKEFDEELDAVHEELENHSARLERLERLQRDAGDVVQNRRRKGPHVRSRKKPVT